MSESTLHRRTRIRLFASHSLTILQRRHRHRRDAFPASERSEPLMGRRLHAYPAGINAQRTRDTLPHRRDVRRQSGLLCDHRSVDVPDLVPRLTNERKRSPEQVDAARVLPLRVVWREVLPDVAESRRAQKRIDDRVQKDVRIAVPGEPDLMRQLHAAKNEIARLIAAVDVVADAYAHGRKINGGAGCRPRGLSP